MLPLDRSKQDFVPCLFWLFKRGTEEKIGFDSVMSSVFWVPAVFSVRYIK